MKKSDVPQEDSVLQKANMTEVIYVTDDDGKYTTAQSTGWHAKNAALDESMALIQERVEQAKMQVARGTASPILYFMEINKMDLGVLSSYTGIWKIFIKNHLKPAGFKKLSSKKLQKYADAFGISVEELTGFTGN